MALAQSASVLKVGSALIIRQQFILNLLFQRKVRAVASAKCGQRCCNVTYAQAQKVTIVAIILIRKSSISVNRANATAQFPACG